MMTRVEELGGLDLDQHKRFKSSSSHALNYEYIKRPTIDEWFEVLKELIVLNWPSVL